MTLFFFVVGLEIRREAYEGELAGLRKAALPLAAALGGMLVPAAIYAALNTGPRRRRRLGRADGDRHRLRRRRADAARQPGPVEPAHPPARARGHRRHRRHHRDRRLLQRRHRARWRAIWPAGAHRRGAGAARHRRAPLGGRTSSPASCCGPACYRAGVHPTLAGVVLGLLTPVRAWYGPSRFAETTHRATSPTLHQRGRSARHAGAARRRSRPRAARRCRRRSGCSTRSIPGSRFAIMPLFALANAGVPRRQCRPVGRRPLRVRRHRRGPRGRQAARHLRRSARWPGWRAWPRGRRAPTRGGILLVGIVGGIGFTMSLFVAQLAFPPGPLLDTAKLAILVGSAAAMVLGILVGLLTLRRRP